MGVLTGPLGIVLLVVLGVGLILLGAANDKKRWSMLLVVLGGVLFLAGWMLFGARQIAHIFQ